MAHIVNCMVNGNAGDLTHGFDEYIAKGVSPQSSHGSVWHIVTTWTFSLAVAYLY